MQGSTVFGGGGRCAVEIVSIGFVDGDHVGKLDHAFLETLELVAGTRQHQHQEEIGHVRNHGFRLAGAHGLDQNAVVARRLDDQHGLARLRGHAAERAGRGGGAYKSIPVGRQPRHAGLVRKDRSAAARG